MGALEGRPVRPAKPTKAGRVAGPFPGEIISGHLAPGARLKLDRMREELGVSVSLLREAVTRLVADGLIGAEEQRGYRVAPISLANLAEITRLRMELEPLALTAAIANGGLDWEADVMSALHRLNRTDRRAGERESTEAWEAAHNTFLRALLAGCDMPLLLRFTTRLQAMNDRYRRIFLQTGADQRDHVEERTAIAEATVARRADAAARLLRAHNQLTGDRLSARLADRLPSRAPHSSQTERTLQ